MKPLARLKIGVLISGRGSNLQALIDRFGASAQSSIRESPASIALVISDRKTAGGLALAEAAGVKTLIIDSATYQNRAEFEQKIDHALREEGIGLVALAGFMRILSGDFTERWHDRLINIHPSLLPAFKGLDTHKRALAAGVRFHGCSVHFVRAKLDDGPIIAQAIVPVLPDDSEESLAARVLKAEHRLYPHALSLIAEGKISIRDSLVHIDDSAFADGSWFNPLGA